MRMLHVFNKPDLALECFKSPELEGLFDQLITYQILLDLLYENGKYQEMLEVFDLVKSKQLQGAKYPRNAVVLVMAGCYKLVIKLCDFCHQLICFFCRILKKVLSML